jgi:hypothetical protein
VRARQSRDESLPRDGPGLQRVFFERKVQKTNVDPPVAQRPEQPVRVYLAQQKLDARKLLTEGPQDGRQDPIGSRGHEPYRQPSDLALADSVHHARRLLGVDEQASRLAQEQAPGVG